MACVQDSMNASVPRSELALDKADKEDPPTLKQRAPQLVSISSVLAQSPSFGSHDHRSGCRPVVSKAAREDPERACTDQINTRRCRSTTCQPLAARSMSTIYRSQHPRVVVQLQEDMQPQTALAHRARLTANRRASDLVRCDATPGASFQSAAGKGSMQVYSQRTERHLGCPQVCRSDHTAKQFSQEQHVNHMPQPGHVSAHLDQPRTDGLAEAYIPSGQYIGDAWPQTAHQRPQPTKRHIYLVSSDNVCLEVTLRIARTVQHDNGQESYRCMLNICDGNGLEISQSYLHTPCLLVVESALKELAVNFSVEKGSKVIGF